MEQLYSSNHSLPDIQCFGPSFLAFGNQFSPFYGSLTSVTEPIPQKIVSVYALVLHEMCGLYVSVCGGGGCPSMHLIKLILMSKVECYIISLIITLVISDLFYTSRSFIICILDILYLSSKLIFSVGCFLLCVGGVGGLVLFYFCILVFFARYIFLI